jgi:hypothetical protein
MRWVHSIGIPSTTLLHAPSRIICAAIVHTPYHGWTLLEMCSEDDESYLHSFALHVCRLWPAVDELDTSR